MSEQHIAESMEELACLAALALEQIRDGVENPDTDNISQFIDKISLEMNTKENNAKVDYFYTVSPSAAYAVNRALNSASTLHDLQQLVETLRIKLLLPLQQIVDTYKADFTSDDIENNLENLIDTCLEISKGYSALDSYGYSIYNDAPEDL